jgi:tetratricopeptide (TPR) repeat protein
MGRRWSTTSGRWRFRALEIREKALPEGDPGIAVVLINIGNTYLELSEYGNALEYHLRALDKLKMMPLEENPTIIQLYDSIAQEYCKIGQ